MKPIKTLSDLLNETHRLLGSVEYGAGVRPDKDAGMDTVLAEIVRNAERVAEGARRLQWVRMGNTESRKKDAEAAHQKSLKKERMLLGYGC